MKKTGLLLIHIILLVIICEFIYGVALDVIVYNNYTLKYGLGFLYRTLPAFTALTLSFAVLLVFSKVPIFVRRMMFVLINLYLFSSAMKLVLESCDAVKNLDAFESGIVLILMLTTGFILIKKIIPKMKRYDYITVIGATIISLIDFTYFMIGYKLFYPGHW